jgi:Fe2+ transport system protein FeoA
MLSLILRLVNTRDRTDAPAPGADTLHLGQVPLQQTVELVSIDLPPGELEPLLERGILPGCQLCPVRRSPGGDPILLVDGTLIAVRRETAACMCVRLSARSN